MIVRFWGVRGSVATPGLETEKFGGNTSCVEISEGKYSLILDAGTGIRLLGNEWMKTREQESINILLSHCHLDHIQGFPFFSPLHDKNFILHIYGPKGNRRGLRGVVASIFTREIFPVKFSKIPARLIFHELGEETLNLGPFKITSFYINHPGKTLGYVISSWGKKVAYLCDHEPIHSFKHLKNTPQKAYQEKLLKHLDGADLLIHDAHFDNDNYGNFKGWGHSPWEYAIDLARAASIPQLAFFHFSPGDTDYQIESRLLEAKRQNTEVPITLFAAQEGKLIAL